MGVCYWAFASLAVSGEPGPRQAGDCFARDRQPEDLKGRLGSQVATRGVWGRQPGQVAGLEPGGFRI